MAGLTNIYICLSKFGDKVNSVHMTSRLLSQYLTSLGYMATRNLTCTYMATWLSSIVPICLSLQITLLTEFHNLLSCGMTGSHVSYP